MELFDGYEDLPDDDKEKIKRALEQGHVDDEDWKGVSLHFPFLSFAFKNFITSTAFLGSLVVNVTHPWFLLTSN